MGSRVIATVITVIASDHQSGAMCTRRAGLDGSSRSS
jgi:hypothetical protein